MPDQDGTLTASEQSKAQSFVQQAIKNPCPLCGSRNWAVHNMIVAPGSVNGSGQLIIGGKVIPQIAAISDCGFIAYFPAMKVGITFGTP